jgi:hypothetical protein
MVKMVATTSPTTVTSPSGLSSSTVNSKTSTTTPSQTPWQMKMMQKMSADGLSTGGLLMMLYGVGKYFETSLNKHFNNDVGMTVFVFSYLCPMILFVVYGLILFCVDMYSSDAFKAQTKIQTQYKPTYSDYFKAAKVAAFNFLVLGLPFSLFVSFVAYPLREKYVQWSWRAEQQTLLPPLAEYFLQVGVFAVVEEIMFYYSHRGLHCKSMYASVHKVSYPARVFSV